MMYRVSIVVNPNSHPDDYIAQHWWKNFQQYNADALAHWKDTLAKFNGYDYPNDYLIEFETDEDFVIFKLKFS